MAPISYRKHWLQIMLGLAIVLTASLSIVGFRACGESKNQDPSQRQNDKREIARVSKVSTPFHSESSSQIVNSWLVADGSIRDMVYSDIYRKIYLGGDFTYLAPLTGSGVILDPSTGQRPTGFAALAIINAIVSAAIPDGAGGYYIGGEFSKVGDVERKYVAHILPNGSLDLNFNANLGCDTTYCDVRAIALTNSFIYIGGFFTSAGNQPKKYLAQLDRTTGAVTTWNPIVNNPVYAIAATESYVYVGGTFRTVKDQNQIYTRNRLAKIDAATGNVAPEWNPNANSTVWSLALGNNSLYVGGGFTSVGGQSRNRLAKLDLATGLAATDWNPGADNTVRTIAIAEPFLYVAGYFTSIGQATRSHLAQFDLASGTLTGWNPVVDGTCVNSITSKDGSVFIGGDFTNVQNQPRQRIAKLDANTADLSPWNPIAESNYVFTLAASGNSLFAGGSFASLSVDGKFRNRIAEIDTLTGKITDWNPSAGDQTQRERVFTLALNSTALFVAEQYSTPNGRGARIVKFKLFKNQPTDWTPAFTIPSDSYLSSVSSLLATHNTLYSATVESTKTGQSSTFVLSAIDTTTGEIKFATKDTDAQIATLGIDQTSLYIGGYFKSILGQQRTRLASVALSNYQLTSWAPEANDPVVTITTSPTSIYAGGYFTIIADQTRNGVAKFNRQTGALESWNPSVTTSKATPPFVSTIALGPALDYLGGSFTSVNSESRYSLAAVRDSGMGNVIEWTSKISNGQCPNCSSVTKLISTCDLLYVTGELNLIGSGAQYAFGALQLPLTCQAVY